MTPQELVAELDEIADLLRRPPTDIDPLVLLKTLAERCQQVAAMMLRAAGVFPTCALCGEDIEHVRGDRWRDADGETACPAAMGFAHRPKGRP